MPEGRFLKVDPEVAALEESLAYLRRRDEAPLARRADPCLDIAPGQRGR